MAQHPIAQIENVEMSGRLPTAFGIGGIMHVVLMKVAIGGIDIETIKGGETG